MSGGFRPYLVTLVAFNIAAELMIGGFQIIISDSVHFLVPACSREKQLLNDYINTHYQYEPAKRHFQFVAGYLL